MAFDQLERSPSRVARLDAELRAAHPRAVIEAAFAEFGSRLALVSSFGAESAVLLHLASQVSKDIPVLFLDTGMLFGQTLDYRKQLAVRLGLTDVRDLRPRFADIAVHDPKADLWKTDTDACCNVRKVIPAGQGAGRLRRLADRPQALSRRRPSSPLCGRGSRPPDEVQSAGQLGQGGPRRLCRRA